VRAPIPFTVIGGFLGAGKTTLVNRLLAAPGSERIAVLVNDFGALDIDGRLIAAAGGASVALANGCLCCTIGDSLSATLVDLLDGPASFDRIVVEASGVADPARIAELAALEPRLARDATVVVVDATDVRRRAADRYVGDTVRRQLAAADLLLLNKADLVAADALAALRAWLGEIGVTAPAIECIRAAVPVAALFGQTVLTNVSLPAPHAPERTFASWSYQWAEPVDRAAVMAILDDLPEGVLRAKGLVRFADTPERATVVQVVGRRRDLADGGAWRAGERSSLVLVGVRAEGLATGVR